MQQSYSSKGGSGKFDRGQRRPQMVFLNAQIKAPTIVIIDAEGNKLGSFPRRVALEMAEEKGLDLVQIRYDQPTMTSTVKMIDYGKYMYQKQKDDKDKKKSQKSKGFKQIKISYMIGENDLNLKIRKAQELLQEGYSVKVLIRLRGREKGHANVAKEKLMNMVEQLKEYGRSQYDTPKQEAQGYSISLFTKVK